MTNDGTGRNGVVVDDVDDAVVFFEDRRALVVVFDRFGRFGSVSVYAKKKS